MTLNNTEMKTTYFKTIFQKSTDTHTIMVAVIPNEMIGEGLPDIYEAQAFIMPKTIYTGTYPNIRINTDTIKDRTDLQGSGISGIITDELWYTKDEEQSDHLGISL